MNFREAHREFQELVRELTLVRSHNLKFKQGDSQESFLGFAECALVLVTLERFLRMILETEAKEKDTLPNLLQKATSQRFALLNLPAHDRDRAITEITNVRNTLLHGNYEQAAQQAGCASVADYFKGPFLSEVEAVYQLTNALVAQIDPATGKPLKA
jgi:hypothetical protein